MRNPYVKPGEPLEFLLGCPSCGTNSVLSDGPQISIECVDNNITIEPEISCPKCSSKFKVVNSNVEFLRS